MRMDDDWNFCAVCLLLHSYTIGYRIEKTGGKMIAARNQKIKKNWKGRGEYGGSFLCRCADYYDSSSLFHKADLLTAIPPKHEITTFASHFTLLRLHLNKFFSILASRDLTSLS